MAKNKAIIIITVCVFLGACLLAGIGVGVFFKVTAVDSADFVKSANLAKDASYLSPDGKRSGRLSLKGGKQAQTTVEFAKTVTINTVVLYEEGKNVTSFEIWDGDTLLDRQEEIGVMRYCAIDPVSVSSLTIKVVSAKQSFNVNKLEAFNIERDNDFRVCPYVRLENVGDESFDARNFANCTEVILFGAGHFDLNGNIYTDDALLERGKAVIRAVNPDVKFHVNFLFKATDEIPEDEKHNALNYGSNIAMGKYREKLIDNLVGYARGAGYDGIEFDYEYPNSMKSWKIYGDFLVALKKDAPELALTAAVSYWGTHLSKKALNALDVINVMGYDSLDSYGNHSGFSQCARKPLEFYIRKGVDLKKLNIGIPFYARPDDMAAYWRDYKYDAQELGRFGCYAETELDTIFHKEWGIWVDAPAETTEEIVKVGKRHFNCVQMVRDKTAFLYDVGVGGVMFWHYGEDLPIDDELSLIGAVTDVLNNDSD